MTRVSAAASAPDAYPTPSTSIALIGTSIRYGPSRSSWPTTIDAATRMNRLHQFRPTMETNPTASTTPATTLSTRCRPWVSVRRGRLHDEHCRQCREQRGRVDQAERLSDQVGRCRGAGEAGGAEDGGSATLAHLPPQPRPPPPAQHTSHRHHAYPSRSPGPTKAGAKSALGARVGLLPVAPTD